EGKIRDKATGKPAKANVEYFPLASNLSRLDYPRYAGMTFTAELFGGGAGNDDGSYRIVGMPGPGFVVVHNYPNCWNYVSGSDREDEFGTKDDTLATAPVTTNPGSFIALSRLNPAIGVGTVKRDLTIDPGWTFTGKVVGPDGNSLSEIRQLTSVTWTAWPETV